jgi:hypothetical protein
MVQVAGRMAFFVARRGCIRSLITATAASSSDAVAPMRPYTRKEELE